MLKYVIYIHTLTYLYRLDIFQHMKLLKIQACFIYMYILHKYIRIPYLYLYNICVVTCYSCISSLCVAFGVHAPTGSQMIVWADVHDNNVAINKMHRGLEQFVCLADSCWRTQRSTKHAFPLSRLWACIASCARKFFLATLNQAGAQGKKKWKRASVRLNIPEITVTRSLLNM